jgi:hypothetical protein
MRLLAGYLTLLDDQGVSMLYCEINAHWDDGVTFAGYEDESCRHQILRLSIDQHTCVSERVGVDCSCFSFDGYHFTSRTSTEKILWLRCISNLKVKLRHGAPNPTEDELKDYRSSVREYSKGIRAQEGAFTKVPLLPHRGCSRGASYDTSGDGRGGATGLASGIALQGLAPPQKMNIITDVPEDDGTDVPPSPGPNVWSPGLSRPPVPFAEVEESLASNPPSSSPITANVGGFGGDEDPVSVSKTRSGEAGAVGGDGYDHGKENGMLRAVKFPQVAYA